MDEWVKTQLREAYDTYAEERDRQDIAPWKLAEREWFLTLLLAEESKTLLEIGAGNGQFGQFCQNQDLEVTSTDLSPEMVKYCRLKGLKAYVMDFYQLDFPPASFDAVFALNCLLHVPRGHLPQVLSGIHQVLAPEGLLYIGTYGGTDFEGVWEEDRVDPKRFFCFHTDEDLLEFASEQFEIVAFKQIEVPTDDPNLHAQSLVARKVVTALRHYDP